MNLTRVVAIMVKLIPRWLMMILATMFLCAVTSFAYVALRRAGLGLIPEAGSFADKASFVLLMSACSFISYWISIRYPVQSRTAAPASLNSSTNSECKS